MPFRVAARTILQLGSELISSDGVAFYELIKNSFDARTKSGVLVDVVIRIPHRSIRALKEAIENSNESLHSIKQRATTQIDHSAPRASSVRDRIEASESRQALTRVLEGANYIEIADTGEGMSLSDLENVYLTVGTKSRFQQRRHNDSDRPILGEKGLGRLAVMRLGMKLRVTTSRKGERHWNVLTVDWKEFEAADADMLDDIAVAPREGREKNDPQESGTTLRIADLTSEWTYEKLRNIAREEFSRITDPFGAPRVKVFFDFNDQPVPIDRIPKLLFEHADAHLVVDVGSFDGQWEVRGEIEYLLRKRKKPLHFGQDHLLNIGGLQSVHEMEQLGPFSVMCHWFNRRRLTAIEGIGDLKAVKKLVEQWGGGLMLFRDGFRVHPYGGPEDDWLQLDPIAFKSRGYKVNRKQIIGKVDITSRANPHLLDQTNREGLRDNLEKDALVSILQTIMSELRTFVTSVDDELRQREALDFDSLDSRVSTARDDLDDTAEELAAKYPAERRIVSRIKAASAEIKEIVDQARELAQGLESRQGELVHLAGIGLMVEIVAHELNRATQFTLSLLGDSDMGEAPEHVQRALAMLESQMKTIQKRLRILDPLSTAGRQHKERFDLIEWVRDILAGHQAQFDRHTITVEFRTIPAGRTEYRVRAVKGMIVQVFENLISNSVYWLKRAARTNPRLRPSISVTVNTNQNQIMFSDNGPGIEPDRREDIFLPFVTTKPAREGKGLGLYVAREIAKYNGGALYLSEKTTVHPKALNTFVFELPADSDER